MSKSFQSAFEALEQQAPDAVILLGSAMLIEEVKQGDAVKELTNESGQKVQLVIAQSANARQQNSVEDDRPMFVRVLKTGPGWYDEAGNTVPVDTKVGDICLIGKLSAKWLSTFGPILSTSESRIGLIRESDILLRFNGQAGFDKVDEILKPFAS